MPFFETPLPEFPPGSTSNQKKLPLDKTDEIKKDNDKGNKNSSDVPSLEENLRKIQEAMNNNKKSEK